MIIDGITLPNPEWGNSVSFVLGDVTVHRDRDNRKWTYIKRSNKVKIIFTLRYADYYSIYLLYDALKSNMRQDIDLTDWNGKIWTNIKLMSDLNITHMSRRETGCQEGYEITLEFIGEEPEESTS